MDDENDLVLVEKEGPLVVITLNRPHVLNAISPALLNTLANALEELDQDPEVRAIVLTGRGRAFAAGADIQAMANSGPKDVLLSGTLPDWQSIRRVNKPLIAAVNGLAYGGGCELAMTCDLIVASETARFAQPEIRLGIMPGAGGTQRLAKAIGPYRAMEYILTGDSFSARQAFEWGLVNRVTPPERCLDEAQELGLKLAAQPPVAMRLAREAVRYGVETNLRDGLEIERRNYTLLFDTADQKEGMAAFLEKRDPEFKGQ